MDLMQSRDQDAIEETVRSFLGKELSLERVRKWFDDGVDLGLESVWRRAGELGFFGLGLAEERGGSGFGLAEEMTLFNELGRSLAPGPWLGTVLAAHALEDEAVRASVLSGEVPCALHDAADGEVRIAGDRVSGVLERVEDPTPAGALLLHAAGRWYFVRRGAAEWRFRRAAALDPTRPLGALTLDDHPCIEVARNDSAASLYRIATILSCAEAVGGIERSVEMSVEYCKVRTQFDQPIGSFQAVKHRCADMAVRAEVARSATIYATICVRDGLDDADRQVAVAKLLCADAYLRNAADNIQNHGGMGFTWECDAHLYLKRAHGFEVGFGSRRERLDDLVAAMRSAQ
jgi:alkylation response protein AidB-like acyl-CoA dehydrogenase